jgi:hypothetical protein
MIAGSLGKMPTTLVRRLLERVGLMHERSSLGEALRQRGGQIIPARLDLRNGFLGEHAAQGGGDHALVRFRDTLQQVAGEMDPKSAAKRPLGATLPHTALELASDGLGQSGVSI